MAMQHDTARSFYLAATAAISFLLNPAFSLAQDPGAIELEPSVVVAAPIPVRTVGDTLIFNPAAYNTEDDAMLEDLIKRIPGLEFDGTTLTLYGRKVEKLLMNGNLYFGGNIAVGLRNISAESIENLSAYERPSDFARISGIDDGEMEPVLDVRIKRRFMEGWTGNTKTAGGVPGRYLQKINLNKITDSSQVAITGGLNNISKTGAPDAIALNKLGTGSLGDPRKRSGGLNYNKKTNRLNITSHLSYDGNNNQVWSDTESRTINATGTNYYSSSRDTDSRGDKLTADASVEWRPRKNLTLLIQPGIVFNDQGSWDFPLNTTYDKDPSGGDAAPLNSSFQKNAEFRTNASASLKMQITRRFEKRGRSLSGRVNLNGGFGKSFQFNDYGVTYKNNSGKIRKQFRDRPWEDREAQAQLSYNEPLGHGLNFQITVNGRYVTRDVSRTYYALEGLAGASEWTVLRNLSAKEQKALLPAGWENARDESLSSDGSYSGFIGTITANVRYIKKKFNTTAGVSLKPIWSDVRYSTESTPDGRVKSFVFYAAPNVSIRYNKSKNKFFAASFNSSVSTPSPDRLIPLSNSSNPLYVRVGNSGLKPALVQKLNLTYNYSRPTKGSSLVCQLSGRLTENAVATSTEYVPETGGRIIRDCNIGGNWSAEGSLSWSRTFRGTPLSISNNASALLSNQKGYLYNSSLKKDEMNVMRTEDIKEMLELKADWNKFDLTVRSGVQLSSGRSLLREDFRQNARAYLAGTGFSVRFMGGWRLSSDVSYTIRRGLTYETMNRDVLLWCASASKRILKGKGTLRLSATDILNQEENMLHRFSGMTISAASFNGTGRYVLLTFSYRFGAGK